jgi:hypothetical protein
MLRAMIIANAESAPVHPLDVRAVSSIKDGRRVTAGSIGSAKMLGRVAVNLIQAA